MATAYGILYEIDKVGILSNTKRIFEDTTDNVNTTWTSLTTTSDPAYGTILSEPVLTATKVSASSSSALHSGQVTASAHWAKSGVTLTSPGVFIGSLIAGSTVGSDGTITVSPSTEGAAASGANADITSMSALTGAIATPTTITASSTIQGTAYTATATTNQLVLGTTRTLTISAPTPATASRTLTIPDAGASHTAITVTALQDITGDGAITIPGAMYAQVNLSKGSAAAITIAAPTSGTDDGKVIDVFTSSAQAHVITCSTDGFNAKGSSGTATFTAAIGNAAKILCDDGHLYVIQKNGVTVA